MKWVGVFFLISLIITTIAVQTVKIKPAEAKQVVEVKKIDIAGLQRERAYWEKVATDSPTYRDSYVQLAVISWQLENKEEARVWIQKALQVDPNWVLPPELAPLLQ